MLQSTIRQVGTIHPDSEISKFCYTCGKILCEECIAIHKNHNSDSMQSIKEKLLKHLATLEQHSDIQKRLHQNVSDLEQHKQSLHERYQKEYALTEQHYDQKVYSICQEKQMALSRLMAFWSIVDRAIENYKAEIQDLQKLTNEFYIYFSLVIEKCSDKEVTAYFIKERRRFVVENIVKTLKEAIRMIQKETGSFLQKEHILQKFKEQTQRIKRKSFICTDLSAIPHSKADKAFKNEYQCLNYEDKLLKIDQMQVNVLGEEHSIFTLPLVSSKVVHTTKQQLMVVSKCPQCLSKLQLFCRTLGEKYPEFNQKDIVISLNNYLLSSNKELFSVTTDAITGIKMAITHLQTKDISLYCKELNKNLAKLDSFVRKSNDYYLKLEEFYLRQQKLHINCDQTAAGKSSVVYISMLLDIMIDCRAYITNTRQICEKLFSIQKTIDFLCKEGNEKESHEIYMGHANSNDSFKKLIASHGFQLQVTMHYSTWVALNEICKTTSELITSWNLERAPFSMHVEKFQA